MSQNIYGQDRQYLFTIISKVENSPQTHRILPFSCQFMEDLVISFYDFIMTFIKQSFDLLYFYIITFQKSPDPRKNSWNYREYHKCFRSAAYLIKTSRPVNLYSTKFDSVLPINFLGGRGGITQPGHLRTSAALRWSKSLYLFSYQNGPSLSQPLTVQTVKLLRVVFFSCGLHTVTLICLYSQIPLFYHLRRVNNVECLITCDIYMTSLIYNIQTMRKVSYLYNDSITNYHFSKEHPMKTKRIKMTHSLIQTYELNDHLMMFQSKEASKEELNLFHDASYVDYLEKWVTGKKDEIVNSYKDEEKRKIRDDVKLKSLFKINQSFDCPGFQGLYHFCQLAAGGSIDAADIILTGISDIAINWAGGYHHAKKSQASGFCYVNDIVICILQLLKVYPRVLYLDIDVHHGDGVQQAFFNTNRVMTVSFHEYEQDFFPGTGALKSVGQGIGKYFSVNVPLKKGMDDITYFQLFKKVMDLVMGSYRPDAVVIQCGADSLSKDRLGHLNLSIKGHAECLNYIFRYGVPAVILGGGGYTIQNVSRCWAYETSVILGAQIDNQIPEKDPFYSSYEHDNHKLHFDIDQRANQNTKEYLDEILRTIVQNIRESEIRPSVAFHSVPKKFLPQEELEWKKIDQDQDSMADSLCEEVFKRLE